MVPKAREDKLIVQPAGEELVVYDEQTHRAHRLNRTAALVWRHCDGRRTVADLAALLRAELNEAVEEDVVWLALDGLQAAGLLQEPLPPSAEEERASRRQAVRKLILTGVAVALPVIATLAVPTPAQAQSGVIG